MTNVTSPDKRGAGGILPSAFHKKTLISFTLGNEKALVSNASSDTESDSQYDKETENVLPQLHQARSTTDSPQANLRHSAMPLQVQVPIVLKNVQHNPSPTDLYSSSSMTTTARPIDVLSPSNSPKLHSTKRHSLMPSSSTPAVLPNARDTTILRPVNVAGGDIVVNGPLSSPCRYIKVILSILPK